MQVMWFIYEAFQRSMTAKQQAKNVNLLFQYSLVNKCGL